MPLARKFSSMLGALLLPVVAFSSPNSMDTVATDITARVPTQCNSAVDVGRNSAEAQRERNYAGNSGLFDVLRVASGSTAKLLTQFNQQGGVICHSSLLNGPARAGVAYIYGPTIPVLVLSTEHKTPAKALFAIGNALGQAKMMSDLAVTEKIPLEGRVLQPGPWIQIYQPDKDFAVRAASALPGGTSVGGLPVLPRQVLVAPS
jgi:hypothetical protein